VAFAFYSDLNTGEKPAPHWDAQWASVQYRTREGVELFRIRRIHWRFIPDKGAFCFLCGPSDAVCFMHAASTKILEHTSRQPRSCQC
jgi:hypothetical protein